MNSRLALLSMLASPRASASWMLLPRYYGNLFGPSLLDSMFNTPSLLPSSSSTMIPRFTESTSLWNKLLDESNQMQQRMKSLSFMSPSYEYKNHDTNITIRTHIPSTMNFENVQVQYDEPNQMLWIRGSSDHNEQQMNGESKDTTTDPPTDKKNGEVGPTTMRSMSHYEFSQTFALDPKIVNVEQLSAHYDEDDKVLTVVVPKYDNADDEHQKPAVRTIPITSTATTNGNSMPTIETTANTTVPSEVKEAVAAH